MNHQMIVECTNCFKKVSIVCKKNISIIEENAKTMISFTLHGTTIHDCNIGE